MSIAVGFRVVKELFSVRIAYSQRQAAVNPTAANYGFSRSNMNQIVAGKCFFAYSGFKHFIDSFKGHFREALDSVVSNEVARGGPPGVKIELFVMRFTARSRG